MKNMYVIIMNGKRYVTTSSQAAWEFCMCFNVLIEEIFQTNRVIDGVEYQERTADEIFDSIKRLGAPFIKGVKGNYHFHSESEKSQAKALWMDGNLSPRQFPPTDTLIQDEHKFDEYGHLVNPDIMGFIEIKPRQMGRTASMMEAIISITGCSEAVAKRVIEAKRDGDQRNITDIAEEFSNEN